MAFSDLPHELESEILSRIAATSLTQLRTTCKRWYSLFKEERFIKKNSSISAATKQLVFRERFGVNSVRINLHKPSIESTGRLKSLKYQKEVIISELSQCDGLLLCKTNDNKLAVWNPCTGQTRWIEIANNGFGEFCLGYKSNNKNLSYKILTTSYPCEQQPQLRYEIYDFNSDSWRTLVGATRNWITKENRPGVSLNGNTYWIAYDHNKDGSIHEFLLKFDFRRERFEHLSLPYEFINTSACRLSVVGQEKLYVLHRRVFQEGTYEMKLWVTDAKIQYSLVAKFLGEGAFTVNSFFVQEENKVFMNYYHGDYWENQTGRTMFGVIELEDGKIHVCGGDITQELVCWWPHLVSYVPSLVQIPQLED